MARARANAHCPEHVHRHIGCLFALAISHSNQRVVRLTLRYRHVFNVHSLVRLVLSPRIRPITLVRSALGRFGPNGRRLHRRPSNVSSDSLSSPVCRSGVPWLQPSRLRPTVHFNSSMFSELPVPFLPGLGCPAPKTTRPFPLVGSFGRKHIPMCLRLNTDIARPYEYHNNIP